jgi:glutathione synthase
MRHILFIDPLEKLNYKKDSTLMMATTMKKMGIDVVLLFEKDFYVDNQKKLSLEVYHFEAAFKKEGFYLENFKLLDSFEMSLTKDDIIHMRIDPPFDTRYLRYLWMLRFYQEKGIRVVNSPDGILKFNEKLHAYTQSGSLPTYVGSSESEMNKFLATQKPEKEFILKPLDLYQGYGVEKVNIETMDIEKIFIKKVSDNNGAIVVQPFCKDVEKGEIRSLYFKGKELGSILKIPKPTEFLANIAQGASFHKIDLSEKVKIQCDQICADLLKEGVDWVAFDIMGEAVSEINITCPGLLVEVSFAHQKNFAEVIAKSF